MHTIVQCTVLFHQRRCHSLPKPILYTFYSLVLYRSLSGTNLAVPRFYFGSSRQNVVLFCHEPCTRKFVVAVLADRTVRYMGFSSKHYRQLQSGNTVDVSFFSSYFGCSFSSKFIGLIPSVNKYQTRQLTRRWIYVLLAKSICYVQGKIKSKQTSMVEEWERENGKSCTMTWMVAASGRRVELVSRWGSGCLIPWGSEQREWPEMITRDLRGSWLRRPLLATGH